MLVGMSTAVGVNLTCNIVMRWIYVKRQGNNTKMVGLDMGNISIRVE